MAQAVRGGLADSWHFGAAAVVAAGGRLVARVGNPESQAFLRSCAKPFQAMPLLLAGGWERYRMKERDLALICASHSGTEDHAEEASRLLGLGDLEEGDLGCGPQEPFDPSAARRLCEQKRQPSPLHNNCSGKHAGMLLACKLLELPTDSYVRADHPLQLQCLEEVARFCELPVAEIGRAVDGCGLPTYRVPLTRAARAYAHLAGPQSPPLSPEHAAAARHVVEAMTSAPRMVAGPGRFTSRLMEATGGRILAKEGALGLFAVAVRGPVALGAALKIADGTEACRDAVVVELLRQLGCLSRPELEELGDFLNPPVTNRRDEVVGEIRAVLELEEV